MDYDEFRRLILQKGEELYRDMPWRQDVRPYYILVSELMLQQTQVDRVVSKFEAFISRFPSEKELAEAALADVLRYWQGLGYNRRAKYLHESAKMVVTRGGFPDNEADLTTLPGVGKNTAGAIMAYAFNFPSLFVETNVRAVYIHHFFVDKDDVDDRDILVLLERTIDGENPRSFYWALMDYGSWLKKQGVRPGRSRHYKKQSPIKGSIREVRGMILTVLSRGNLSIKALRNEVAADRRFDVAYTGLMADGLIEQSGDAVHLTK
jgi:A/G-specific adenine glycosylase